MRKTITVSCVVEIPDNATVLVDPYGDSYGYSMPDGSEITPRISMMRIRGIHETYATTDEELSDIGTTIISYEEMSMQDVE
jgi:hypothetical protein